MQFNVINYDDILSLQLTSYMLHARLERQRLCRTELDLQSLGARSEVARARATHEADCGSLARRYSNALLLLVIAGLLIPCGVGGGG